MLTFPVRECLVLKQKLNVFILFIGFCLLVDSGSIFADPFVDTIAKVKPSVVGVGTFQKTRNPPYVLAGTGFVAGSGNYVVTSNHIVPQKLDHVNRETLAVFIGSGKKVRVIAADLIRRDELHDLALLEISEKLPAVQLAGTSTLPDGYAVGMTGYPLGMVLGVYPITHQGIIAASVPLAIPPANQKSLTTSMIRALRNPYKLYQVDAVAYPGNSGSPLYDRKTGKVVGVVSSGYVKGNKENALSAPTGITYAIPVKYVHELIKFK